MQPPTGFFPRQQSASSIQDPLSSIPHQTFQAHRAAGRSAPRPNSTLPVASSSAPARSALVNNADVPGATVSAAPQLRDLKKEATAFTPSSLKRKRPGAAVSSTTLNAAPSLASGTDEPIPGPVRPDLLGTLKNQFGPLPSAKEKKGGKDTGKDDYEKFVEEMGDILGT
jgi:hypothetical protein